MTIIETRMYNVIKKIKIGCSYLPYVSLAIVNIAKH